MNIINLPCWIIKVLDNRSPDNRGSTVVGGLTWLSGTVYFNDCYHFLLAVAAREATNNKPEDVNMETVQEDESEATSKCGCPE